MGYRKRTSLTFPLTICLFFLASCGATAPSLPPEEIITRSAARMAEHTSFEFIVEREGAPAFLDPAETISFRRAEGMFVSPDRAQTTVRVIAPGLVAEVQLISIADSQWETNLFSGEWQPSDPRYTFNPTLLFNPQSGISAVLASDLTNPTLLGVEELPEIPGLKLYVIRANLQGTKTHQMTFGMIDDETLTVTLWIDPQTFDLHRIVLIDPANPSEEESTSWQVDLWNFGSTFEIQPPSIP